MKAVLDTNVFVSSFFGGNPRQVIDLWKTGELTLCLSKDVLDEYVAVLERLFGSEKAELKELLYLLAKGPNLPFTIRTPKLHIVDEDPDDDKFIACAVALKAEYLVTGDKALLRTGSYGNVRILTPADFLKERSRG
jgi:putative PIN family toxin of toxin-antitoxin system